MVKDEVIGREAPPEPIEQLNAPKTKQVRRLSFYFHGGTAMDFNLEVDDKLQHAGPDGDDWLIIKASDGSRTSIYRRHVSWWRDVTFTVKIREPKTNG